MTREAFEARLRTLVDQAWDQEVRWSHIDAWIKNFDGQTISQEDEQLYCMFLLSRFMYFSKRLVREMLKSLYRDHFESVLLQRIRRNFGGTSDAAFIRKIFAQELKGTRFVGVGNPAESGAHLLYYFRQINYLPKNLFVDLAGAFQPSINRQTGEVSYQQKDSSVSRYVFFDDLVGSGTQASNYLTGQLNRIRKGSANLDLRFMALFATTEGLEKMNAKALFDGQAICLFELDETYKAFAASCRYFSTPPIWFQVARLFDIAKTYGEKLKPGSPLGYKDGQLLLGFSHNTPDNTLPIFWDEGHGQPWSPVFLRYDKIYGVAP